MSRIKTILDTVGLEEGSPERNQVERELRERLKRQLLGTDDPEYEAKLHARAKDLLKKETRH